ncbi:MAG: Calx-beta domain-containing protein [Woeseia sp.]
MKHKLTSGRGAARCAHVPATIARLARSMGLTLILLGASASAGAQVTVSVIASDDTASETPAENGEFLIRREGENGSVTVNYSLGGTASPGADYVTPTGRVTLGAGQSEAAVTVDVPGDDGLFEGDETVTLTLLEEDDGDDVVVENGSATVTILDSPHSLSASRTSNAIENPPEAGEFRVSLDGRNESGNPLTVQYTVSGTASAGSDYEPLSGVAEIPTGASAASVDVVPLDDDQPEGEETVEITLAATSDARVTLGEPKSASLTISDGESDEEVVNDTTVSVVASDADASESPPGNGEFRVRRDDGDMDRAITVSYDVSGTATPGTDYSSLPETVTLAASQSEATIPVDVQGDDDLFEGDETVTITLRSDESSGIRVGDGSATVTIADSPHSVTVSRGSNAAESPLQAGRFDVSLGARNESGEPLNVEYSVAGTATAGSDYESLSGSAVIAEGSTSASVEVTPIDDDSPEDNETVEITLTATSDPRAAVGEPATASLSISDGDNSDQPSEVTLSVSASDADASESSNDGQFSVRRADGDMNRPVTVTYEISGTATPGADFASLPGSVTLPESESEANITIDVRGDDLFEGEETVTITLREDTGAGLLVSGGSATVTIEDSEHAVTVSSGSNAVENPAQTGEIVVSLDARNESGDPLTVDYSVNGTATADADYEALSGSAVIAIGSSTATIDVAPLDDDSLEGAETVVVTLTATSDARAPVAQTATATLTIVDDEADGDDDGDGISNSRECPDFEDCPDTDENGIPDYQDSDDDGDGIPTTDENAPDQDTNGDGVPDYLDDDDDGDGRPTADEDANEDGDGNPATNPTDSDGNGVPDYLDADDQAGPEGDLDSDGLSNEREEELGTDPQLADTDADGITDGEEVDDGSDPLDHASFADADNDLVPDAIEASDGSDPNDADSFPDGDGGGTADHIETVIFANHELSPTDVGNGTDDSRDSDGDGLPDRLEVARGWAPDSGDSPTGNGGGDDSGNGILNAVEAYLESLGIEPVETFSDFDRDLYPDAVEVSLGMNPLRAAERDSDGDGVPNIVELLGGLDIDPATDRDADGVPDAREIASGSDPLDANAPAVNGAQDDDGDGVSNAIEQVLEMLGGSSDTDGSSDADGDGISDADEIRFGTNPFRDDQPVAWIELKQIEIGPVSALSTSAGNATAIAMVGGHQTGTLAYDWSGSDNAVLAVVAGGQREKTLTFAPQTLPPGPYNLVLRVERTVGSYSSPVSTVKYTVNVLRDADATELADVDHDGIPDASDSNDSRQGFANELQAHSSAKIMTNANVRLQLGSTARTTRAPTALVTMADIAAAGDGSGGSVGNSEDNFDYRSGLFDFEVTNLPEAGNSVQVVIPQAGAIGEFPEYRKYLPDRGWGAFVEDSDNAIASASGSNGECPAPNADAWEPGLSPGHNCVQLTIEDGGPNDGDAGEGPNGIIKDPGGVATPKGEVSVGQGGGRFGLGGLLLLGLAVVSRACRFTPATGRTSITAYQPPQRRVKPTPNSRGRFTRTTPGGANGTR